MDDLDGLEEKKLTHMMVVENKSFKTPPLKKTQRHIYINEQPGLYRGGCVFHPINHLFFYDIYFFVNIPDSNGVSF